MKRLTARAAIATLAAAPLALFTAGPAAAAPDGVIFTASASGNTLTTEITNNTGADVYCFQYG
ncbi:MAG: hypothetical protein EOP28_02335 [Rhodococcus sp. (in: high G+C Gram-positive bacteria)]|nr:MAG: hypothetical protein EOP28_02335 [Rhodococcus sp. (in: high G+C Gram-positive bacteria)]